jgi:hypothetical protein
VSPEFPRSGLAGVNAIAAAVFSTVEEPKVPPFVIT